MKENNTILVIDDSNTALLLMEYALKEAGYKALIVTNVKDAIAFLKQTTPCMILLDLSMPEISGYDFLKMKTELHIETIPILVVSAYDSVDSVETVKNLGAIDFVPKPIRIDTLMDKIRTYLK
jgi:DNA-binding NtrC family response regulator